MTSENKTPYRVLALKYRPQNFDALIGQDALVRTLKNAIETGRLANAYMLTGVRGVGKTTTARIIAKALNYQGPDGKGKPTTDPTDDCPVCKAIAEDRHPDVLEMDAASRTGVDDIREILDGVRYAPTEARYKVYIIDEVHMLSRQAFNALLKTLEEPPPHVKFIFATTEIRKVPVTVLSRCQRFDLRRVDVDTLATHFTAICEKEETKAEAEAIALIARAADGSVRDGLSLLDQAIALSDGQVKTETVQDMLGLSDRAKTVDLLEKILAGEAKEALEISDSLHKAGADPLTLLQDLLEATHILTRLKAVPGQQENLQVMSADQISRCADLAKKLSMPSLGKAWQILLKGTADVQSAPNPQQAAEMVIIRLIYAANLPDPADLLKKLKENGEISANNDSTGTGPLPPPPSAGKDLPAQARPSASSAGGGRGKTGGQTAAAVQPRALPETETALLTDNLQNLEEIVKLLEEHDELVLASQIYQFVHLIKIENRPEGGRLEIRMDENAPPNVSQNLRNALKTLTGRQWFVSLATTGGAPTLAEQAGAHFQSKLEAVKEHPLIQDILKHFPEAEITDIKG